MAIRMTEGSEWRVILLFSLPIMGTNLLQAMYNLADSLIVGNFVGPTALGAVGLTGSMCWLLLTCCVGIGTGTSIVVSQYYGAARSADIRASVGAAYTLSLLFGGILTILCLLLAKPLIWGFLGAPQEMRGMSLTYYRIYVTGIAFQMLYNVTYGILRAHGDSRSGFYFLLVSATLNVGLDVAFIVCFGWGAAGAAGATVISQAVSASLSIAYLTRRFPALRPRVSMGVRERAKMRTIAAVATPIIVQSGIFAVGFTIMQRLVNSFGPHSIEGYAAMGKIEELAHIPSKSFNEGICAFAGQNIGAGRAERARKGYKSALVMGTIVTLTIAVLVVLFSKSLLGTFNISGESMRRGREHLVLLMFFMIFFMTSHITSGFLQGAGDVRLPAVAGLVNLTVRLGCAFWMAGTFIDFRSVYFSMPPATLIGCAIVVMRYRSGKWREYALI